MSTIWNMCGNSELAGSQKPSLHPLLWENDTRIEQVWFPGVHCNVGGGYLRQGMSLVTLDWMMKKAEDAGIKFVANDVIFVKVRKYTFDKLYNSRAGIGVYYRYKPRNIAKICEDNKIKAPNIHVSVFERISQSIFGYAPGNLPTTFEVIDNEGGLHKNPKKIADFVNQNLAHKTLLDQVEKYIYPRNILY